MLIGTVVLFDIWVGVVIEVNGNSIIVAKNDGTTDTWDATKVSLVCRGSDVLKELRRQICKKEQ